jgi:hypothetical protein
MEIWTGHCQETMQCESGGGTMRAEQRPHREDLPHLNDRVGQVVEAEIFRRFGLAINLLPSSRAKPFFLVLSVGRYKFRLSISFIEHLLQAVLGGLSRGFDAV